MPAHRLLIVIPVLCSLPARADGPLISRDGNYVGWPTARGGLTGHQLAFSICEVGSDACTEHVTAYESTEGEIEGTFDASKLAARLRAGEFTPLQTVALQRPRTARSEAEELDAIDHGARVTRFETRARVGRYTLIVRGQQPARVSLWTRGKHVGSRELGCDARQRVILPSAFAVGEHVYVAVSCPFSFDWKRISP